MVGEAVKVPEFLGQPYNYDIFARNPEQYPYFRSTARAGERAPDFTLPLPEGGEITLSSLRGKPVVMEFGNIT